MFHLIQILSSLGKKRKRKRKTNQITTKERSKTEIRKERYFACFAGGFFSLEKREKERRG